MPLTPQEVAKKLLSLLIASWENKKTEEAQVATDSLRGILELVPSIAAESDREVRNERARIAACKVYNHWSTADCYVPRQDFTWHSALQQLGLEGHRERLVPLFAGNANRLNRWNFLWRIQQFANFAPQGGDTSNSCHKQQGVELKQLVANRLGQGIDAPRLIEIVGPAGVGKSSLIFFSRSDLQTHSHVYIETSVNEQRRTPSIADLLFPLELQLDSNAESLNFLLTHSENGAMPPVTETLNQLNHASELGRALGLARLYKRLPTVLIFDGFESFTSPDGGWVHPVVKAFLKEILLVPDSKALVIVTTRWSWSTPLLQELRTDHIAKIPLSKLGVAEAVEFLSNIRVIKDDEAKAIVCADSQLRQSSLEKLATDICWCLPIYLNLYGTALARKSVDVAEFVKNGSLDSLRLTGNEEELHCAAMLRYVDAFLLTEDSDPITGRDSLYLLVQIAICRLPTLTVDLVAELFWNNLNDRFQRAKKRLVDLALISLDSKDKHETVAMHPQVRAFFREFNPDENNPTQAQADIVLRHGRYFSHGESLIARNSAMSLPFVIAYLRHGISANRGKEVVGLLSEQQLGLRFLGPLGGANDYLELLNRLNPIMPGESTQDERFFVQMQTAAAATTVNGMADELVRTAARNARREANSSIQKAMAETVLWRNSLVRGDFESLSSHIEVLRACGADPGETQGHWNEVVENALLYERFFTAIDVPGVAAFDPPMDANDAREAFLRSIGTMYDPRVTGHLFASWGKILTGKVEEGFVQCQRALEISKGREFGGAALLLAMYFNIAIKIIAGRNDGVVELANALITIANNAGEDFLVHGAKLHLAETDTTRVAAERLESMTKAIKNWQKGGAKLMLPFLHTRIAHFALMQWEQEVSREQPTKRKKGQSKKAVAKGEMSPTWLKIAKNNLELAAEYEQSGEKWYHGHTLLILARLHSAQGDSDSAEGAKQRAFTFARKVGIRLPNH